MRWGSGSGVIIAGSRNNKRERGALDGSGIVFGFRIFFLPWGKGNILLSQKQNFAIKNIKFVILATQNDIKFVIVSIKFVIVRAPFSRIMRAREDRHNSRCL